MTKGLFVLKIKTLLLSIFIYCVSWIALWLIQSWPWLHSQYEWLESHIYFQILYLIPTDDPHKELRIIDREGADKTRDEYAHLIMKLDSLGAKVIAFDVLFWSNPEISPEQNAALIAATNAASDKIVHAVEFLSEKQGDATSIPDRFRINVPPHYKKEDNFIGNIRDCVLPFDSLLQVTSHLGSITASSDEADRDEQYFPMLIYYKNDVYPSLPFLSVIKFMNVPTDTVKHLIDDKIELMGKPEIIRIPLDGRCQTLINFISESAFDVQTVSLKYFLESDNIDANDYKDKIVLIGDSKTREEQSPGPGGKPYPNLFIYASLISQILNNKCIKDGIMENFLSSFILILLGLIWIFYFEKRFKRIKPRYVFIFAFIAFLLFSIITLACGTKTYIILPYIVFCASYSLSRKYYHLIPPLLQVFISYSHRDQDFVLKLKTALEASRVKIKIDTDAMQFGDDINEFINLSIPEADFTISVVSINSLKSPWVITEALETLMYEHVKGVKKFIPIYIDKSFLEDKIQREIIEIIDEKLDFLKDEIIKLLNLGVPTVLLENKRRMLLKFRNNIGEVLNKLNESLVADFSTEEKFNSNLPKLVQQIKSTTKKR